MKCRPGHWAAGRGPNVSASCATGPYDPCRDTTVVLLVGSGAPGTIYDANVNVAEMLTGASAVSSGEAVALHDGDAATTYAGFAELVGQLRAAVRGRLRGNRRVAVIGANSSSYLAAVVAALGAGAAVMPVNPRTPGPELDRLLGGAEPVLVIEATGVPAGRRPGVVTVTVDELLSNPATPIDLVDIVQADDADPALLMSTSGTSGTPRIAVLSHGNVAANLGQTIAGSTQLTSGHHTIMGVMPMTHVLGLVSVAFVSLHLGHSLVVTDDLAVDSILALADRHAPTVLVAPPVFWFRIGTRPPEPERFASVQLALSGAAPLSGAVARSVEAASGLRLQQGYGLTEASPALSTALGTDAPATSVGRPLRGVELRLIDEFGDDVLVGDVGEIHARGPNVFSGYLNDPDATAEVLDDAGWLRTGDLAVVDEHGHLFIVGRNKDLIIVSGFNVHPEEVERTLISHSDIIEAAVVGEPDREFGELVVAHVVAAPGATVDERAVIEHCRDALVAYKVPARIEVTDQLPRGATGKVRRRTLRD